MAAARFVALLAWAAPLHTVASRADAAACVVNGRANASCFGSNATDATEILQAALSSNASYLLIDDIGRPWIVRPLFLSKATDMVIELQPRVHILARRDWFHGEQDSLLQISQAKNLTINGNGALLQMRRDDYAQPPRGTCPSCSNYTKAEWYGGKGLSVCPVESLL
jgi:polysaccharide pyruvyl transferase WcaK-like protein